MYPQFWGLINDVVFFLGLSLFFLLFVEAILDVLIRAIND